MHTYKEIILIYEQIQLDLKDIDENNHNVKRRKLNIKVYNEHWNYQISHQTYLRNLKQEMNSPIIRFIFL